MAKRSAIAWRGLGAMAIGAAVLIGASGGAWGQGAKPDAAEVEEARRLNREQAMLYAEGKYDEAMRLAELALAIGERALEKDHPDVATLLNNLATLYKATGDYTRAEPLYLRAISIWEKALGLDHPHVATALNSLAALYAEKGDYARAEPLYQRALGIRENALGPDHPDVATSLNNVAALYKTKGDYARAESLIERALGIQEKVLGPDHPDVATLLNNLALLYKTKGDYAKAEPLYQRALGIREKAFGPDHPHVAQSLNNLAELYRTKGDYARAEPLFQRALGIWEKALGPDHPLVAISVGNLAVLYMAKGDYARAEALYLRALGIREKKRGPEHPDVAISLNNLAELYRTKGDYTRAESFYLRALAIMDKALGLDHPNAASTLNNLAVLYYMKGDYARAEPLYQRALAIKEKMLGPEHPDVAMSLNNLAELHWAKNDILQALQEQERANSIEDRNAARELAVGVDEQRRAYMEQLRAWTVVTISLHVQSAPHIDDAKQLALRTILRRKGLVLDAMSNSFAALRQRLTPADQQKFDEWRSLTAQYSALAQRQPGRDVLKTINDARQKLENELSFRSKDLQAQLTPLTIEQVQAAIPEGAALVELFQYQPFNPTKAPADQWGKARYVAYVLHHTGQATFADLGEAAPIETAVKALRNALSRAATDPKPAARDLYQRVMAPITKLLGETRHVYLSPDGALNLVPFGALMTDAGHYLAETHSITYLPSGRDLVRMGNSAPSRQGAVVFAEPGYELGDKTKERSLRQFTALRYSGDEVQSITALLGGANTVVGIAATEDAIKTLRAPKILHISTHGFFDKDDPALHGAPDKKAILIENALLHSGLGFAGANRGGIGKEDGILTALEASQLDLWGTKLVVLSACETGMGQAENGDSVYGLRRAFTMAGAETVVMSLWQVDGAATTDLMKAYYQGLSAHGGRAEALRQAQLAMLSSADRSHPHYWSSFIVSGDDRSMEGQLVDASFGQVNRGGGCGACEIAGSANGDERWSLFALTLAAGIAAGRRRPGSLR